VLEQLVEPVVRVMNDGLGSILFYFFILSSISLFDFILILFSIFYFGLGQRSVV